MASLAAEATRPEPGREDTPPSPVDLDYLDRQTFGDSALQRQVLTLFQRQLVDQIERLKAARTADERREAAHTLVGAARGIGAFSVADLASAVEHAHGSAPASIAALEQTAGRVQDFIVGHLSG